MLLYKFKHEKSEKEGKDFQPVPLDRAGNVAPAAEYVLGRNVKKAIVVSRVGTNILNVGANRLLQRQRLEKLERQDFDLRLFNADSGYEYADETKFVPTNASAVAFQGIEEEKATETKNINLDVEGNVRLIVERYPVPPGKTGILVRLASLEAGGDLAAKYRASVEAAKKAEKAAPKASKAKIYTIVSQPDEEDEFFYVGDDNKNPSSSSPSNLQSRASAVTLSSASSDSDTQDDDEGHKSDRKIKNNYNGGRSKTLDRLMIAVLERSTTPSPAERGRVKSEEKASEFCRGNPNSTTASRPITTRGQRDMTQSQSLSFGPPPRPSTYRRRERNRGPPPGYVKGPAVAKSVSGTRRIEPTQHHDLYRGLDSCNRKQGCAPFSSAQTSDYPPYPTRLTNRRGSRASHRQTARSSRRDRPY